MRRPVDFRAVHLTFHLILSIALMCIEDTVQNATGEKFAKKAFVREFFFAHTELCFRKWGDQFTRTVVGVQIFWTLQKLGILISSLFFSHRTD